MWENLINAIIAVIRTNGNSEITGQLLQDSLIAIINNVGANYGLLGVAIPTTDPGTYGGDIAYFATTPGVYENMGNVEIEATGLYLILRTGENWTLQNLFPFNVDEINEAIRKSLNPSGLTTYLANNYTTAALVANTPTKIVLPVTPKYAQDFQIAAGGGAQFLRDSETMFKIYASTSMETSTNNVVVKFYMYKNGVPVPGVAIQRKVATGGDVGAMALIGEFTAVKDDIMEIYVEASLATTITFIMTSFVITEKN